MGWRDEAKTQMRHGEVAAERIMAGRSTSSDAMIKARLSVYWPAALIAMVTAGSAWRLGPLRAVGVGLVVGLFVALALTAVLRCLLARARAATVRRD